MIEHGTADGHHEFRELAALANSGALTREEWAELKGHLESCEECREIYREYRVLSTNGMSMLEAGYGHRREEEEQAWNDRPVWEKLLARVRAAEQRVLVKPAASSFPGAPERAPHKVLWNSLARAALVACLVLATGIGAYYLGRRKEAGAIRAQASAEDRLQALTAEKKAADELVRGQARRLSELQRESISKEQELAKLQAALQIAEDRVGQLTTAQGTTEEQLRSVSQQRDALRASAEESQRAYLGVEEQMARLRSERDKALLRTASLESRIEELSASNREQKRKLQDDEQYLASDRDIRELMGARKLYIADVFDVDSSSRTRKPFGRVFYTQGKFLLFYAFDLDRQQGLKNAAAFQAWGQRQTPQGEQAAPLSLGILYMDNEANRRWVLRCDDPKRLAEIDAVFVTVEPHGGSPKPTGKAFLYAMLRKEANHP